MGTTRGQSKFSRWQKGKLILLASLSCWIVFTLPLGFAQPPATSCIVEKNGTFRLEVPDLNARSKRSTNVIEYYHRDDDEDENLEVAENVVFERLTRSIDDNKRFMNDKNKSRQHRQADFNSDETTDLKYKQFVPQDGLEDDPNAKEIDFRSIAKQNRPADVLEYKRFLKVSIQTFKEFIEVEYFVIVKLFSKSFSKMFIQVFSF